ncbi:hypothetical protein [Arthrobacter sp. NicSoilC12]|uniref:hypothetical protein n=1 Tax=Arthrobacter sp. NicSoilC12 TaxID=2831001 RepID=UPI001CC3B08F|nr:hypothetical protein [Arthrobacter sp. NicSoilC12]GIU56469.1 hypothetical protein NicSoilC12_22180 [Arthrobacter sp. NicSoilC12]
MITGKFKYAAATTMLGLICVLTACGMEAQQSSNAQSSQSPQHTEFGSIEEARRAVVDVIGCEEAPKTAPIINPELAGYTAEYAVCSKRVQVEWFKTEEARNAEQQLYAESTQPLAIVEGKNWMVVDMSEALQESPSGMDLKGLAQELGGQFKSLDGARQS